MTSVTIGPAAAVSAVEPGTARSATAAHASAVAASAASTAKSGLGYPNPALRLDPQAGLVVIEFYDKSGQVTQTIPNAQQISAYRKWSETRQGSNPLTGAPGDTAPRPASTATSDAAAAGRPAAAGADAGSHNSAAPGAPSGGTTPVPAAPATPGPAIHTPDAAELAPSPAPAGLQAAVATGGSTDTPPSPSAGTPNGATG